MAHADGLSAAQLDSLAYVAKEIKSCNYYTLNYGQNKPLDDGCVNRLVESASGLYAAFLPDQPSFLREVKSIEKCPFYTLNYGQNKPYEEGCVGRIVDNLVADFGDLKAKIAPQAK
jgi:hypothetical protein